MIGLKGQYAALTTLFPGTSSYVLGLRTPYRPVRPVIKVLSGLPGAPWLMLRLTVRPRSASTWSQILVVRTGTKQIDPAALKKALEYREGPMFWQGEPFHRPKDAARKAEFVRAKTGAQ